MLIVYVNQTLGISLIFFALVYGGIVERRAGWVMAVFMASGWIGHRVFGPSIFEEVDTAACVQDVIGFVGFSLLGIFGYKLWPLLCGSLQLISLSAHVIRYLSLDVRPIVYATMKSGPTWLVMIVMGIGILNHHLTTTRSARLALCDDAEDDAHQATETSSPKMLGDGRSDIAAAG